MQKCQRASALALRSQHRRALSSSHRHAMEGTMSSVRKYSENTTIRSENTSHTYVASSRYYVQIVKYMVVLASVLKLVLRITVRRKERYISGDETPIQ